MRTVPLLLTSSILCILAGCSAALAVPDAPREPVFAAASAPASPPDRGRGPLPAIPACEDERVEVALAEGDDDRCTQSIVIAAATAFLYVGSPEAGEAGQMSVHSYESAHAVEDALDDPEFEQLLRRADASPRDGKLGREEALELERRVAVSVEGR
jgi:hypothetical protein